MPRRLPNKQAIPSWPVGERSDRSPTFGSGSTTFRKLPSSLSRCFDFHFERQYTAVRCERGCPSASGLSLEGPASASSAKKRPCPRCRHGLGDTGDVDCHANGRPDRAGISGGSTLGAGPLADDRRCLPWRCDVCDGDCAAGSRCGSGGVSPFCFAKTWRLARDLWLPKGSAIRLTDYLVDDASDVGSICPAVAGLGNVVVCVGRSGLPGRRDGGCCGPERCGLAMLSARRCGARLADGAACRPAANDGPAFGDGLADGGCAGCGACCAPGFAGAACDRLSGLVGPCVSGCVNG